MDDYLSHLKTYTESLSAIKRIHDMSYEYNARECVYQHDKVSLYHYQSRHKQIHAIPLLVVFATVNRPEVLDLFPEQSFIRGLLDQGMDVYLLDWGYAEKQDQHITF